jgi:peptidoglycan DL-endopeptidase CwlO
VEQLNHEAEIATERYNEAVERLHAAEKRLEVVQDRIAAQQRKLNALQDELGAFAALAYRNAGMDKTLQLLTSNDPTQFLNQASTLDQLSDQQAGVLRRLQAAQQELQVTRMKADQEIDEIESARKELSTQKRTVEEKLRKARALLNQLTAEQRQQIVSPPPTDPPPTINATGRAGTAVAYAKAQLGDPYVWGSAGPDSFDCSGLTMAAWAAAGVSLPHSSAGQYGYGQFVPQSSLAPGDLVFYYSPISHVGIYIGSGLIIHSPHAGDVVRVAGVNSMPYVGARRVG